MPPPPPPTTAAEALAWTQDAMANHRYVPHPHLFDRFADRSSAMREVRHIIRNATSCEPYAARGGPQAGGTTWRIWGLDFDGTTTGIGVETFADHLGRRVLLITLLGGSKP